MNELIAAIERLLGRGIVVEPVGDGSLRVRLADDPSDENEAVREPVKWSW